MYISVVNWEGFEIELSQFMHFYSTESVAKIVVSDLQEFRLPYMVQSHVKLIS